MSKIIIELEKDELRQLMEAVQNAAPKKEIKEVPEILNADQVCRLLNMKKSTLYQKTHK